MSELRRLRWVKATLGSKPGAEAVLGPLLSGDDLPSGRWKRRDQRTWRTGEGSPDAPWAARARAVGSVTAWRSFENRDSSQWLWCQLTPLASPADAELAIVDLPSKMLSNLRADVEVIASRDVSPPDVPGASRLWAHEQMTNGPRGEGLVRYLAGTAGQNVFILGASGGQDGWTLPALGGLAQAQAARISGTLEDEDDA